MHEMSTALRWMLFCLLATAAATIAVVEPPSTTAVVVAIATALVVVAMVVAAVWWWLATRCLVKVDVSCSKCSRMLSVVVMETLVVAVVAKRCCLLLSQNGVVESCGRFLLTMLLLGWAFVAVVGDCCMGDGVDPGGRS